MNSKSSNMKSNTPVHKQRQIIREAHHDFCDKMLWWQHDWDEIERMKAYSYERPTASHKRMIRNIESVEYQAFQLLKICQEAIEATYKAPDA